MSITSTCARNFRFDNPSTPDNVGPGSYNIPERKIKKTSIPFGSTTRRDLFNLETQSEEAQNLGPGTYNIRPASRPRSGLSPMGLESERNYFIDRQKTPSPADHSPLRDWVKKRPTTGLSQRPRTIDKYPPAPKPEKITPGPGAYEVLSKPKPKGAKFSLSRTPQREPARYNGIPGPGAYEQSIPDKKSAPASPPFKSRARRQIFNNPVNDSAMVCHFAWMPEIFEGRPFGGEAKRELDWGSPGKDSPGPQVHAEQEPKVMGRTSDGAFGISSRESNREERSRMDNPGPGFYDIPPPPPKRCGSSMLRSRESNLWNVSQTPSPGQYDGDMAERVERKMTLRTASPAFKDRGQRYQCMDTQGAGPGPGKYFSKLPTVTGGCSKFPRDPRFTPSNFCGRTKMNDGPSPADYSVETRVTKKKVAGGLIPRDLHDPTKGQKNRRVGPGSYGKVKCDMMKPSYNVMFDPEMKRKTMFESRY